MANSNVIITANPAHATEEERDFWHCFATRVQSRGWHLFQLATRNIPDLPGARTICVPARLRQTPPLPLANDTELLRQQFRWIEPEVLDLMIEWEHLRWQDPEHDAAMRQGQLRLLHFVDRSVALLRPSVVLTTNKIDHNVALFRAAALAYGASAGFVERSPFDDYWYEPDGMFGESVIPERYARDGGPEQSPAVLDVGRGMIKRMSGNPYGFRKGEGGAQGADESFLDGLPRPLWFLPMDNVLWTGLGQRNHPQRPVDYPFYDDHTDALKHIHAMVQRIGGTLVVKHHPSCVIVNPDSLPPGAVFHDGDLRLLIDKSDVVITLLTKLAFVALAMGKPVVTLAHNPAAASGSTFHCQEREQVEPTLRAALAREGIEQRLDAFAPFAGWLACKYFFAMHDHPVLPQQTPMDLADKLIDATGPPLPQEDTELDAIEKLLRAYAGQPPLRQLAVPTPAATRPADLVRQWGAWARLHHHIETAARTLFGDSAAQKAVRILFGPKRSERLRQRYARTHSKPTQTR